MLRQIGSEAGEYTNRLRLLLIGSFLSGIVALAYEIIWTHVLSFLIGNTVYAFGLMLFTFLPLPVGPACRRILPQPIFDRILSYQAPKGIALPYDTIEPNTTLLHQFRALGLPSELPIRDVPSESERKLILGYVAKRRGNLDTARACFSQVEGIAHTRAQLNISARRDFTARRLIVSEDGPFGRLQLGLYERLPL